MNFSEYKTNYSKLAKLIATVLFMLVRSRAKFAFSVAFRGRAVFSILARPSRLIETTGRL